MIIFAVISKSEQVPKMKNKEAMEIHIMSMSMSIRYAAFSHLLELQPDSVKIFINLWYTRIDMIYDALYYMYQC